MSKATKLKYVAKEVDDLSLPTESQSIVRISGSRGNNLHEVEDPMGNQYLVSMPTKFRRKIWVKHGDFVLVEPILEGDKVKAEIVKILTREHQKYYRAQSCWPQAFDKSFKGNSEKNATVQDLESDDLFVNRNRLPLTENLANSATSTSESDTDQSESS